MNSRALPSRRVRQTLWTLGTALLLSLDMGAALSATPPQVAISQIPLTLVIPAHPQVVMIVGNSESMDGNVSGAIVVGSGAGTAVKDLTSSSSPILYAVPSGYTPPLVGPDVNGNAPITVDGSLRTGSAVSGTLYDNSKSRLNLTKLSIKAVLNTYAPTTDFALMDYSTGTPSVNTTWVYYMSDASGFTFNTTGTTPAGDISLPNPCFGANGGDETAGDCTSMGQFYSPGNSAHLSQQNFVNIATTSDNPAVNDVLYASGLPSVFVTYNGPSPASPYPPSFQLTDYEAGKIFLSYSNSAPNIGSFGTGPTNAGFVPSSPQVMYAQRGFGYSSSVSGGSGNLLLPLASAGTGNTPPTLTQLNAYLATFATYLAPETSDPTTSEIKSSAGQSPLAGPLKQAYAYYTGSSPYTKVPASSNGCTPLRYVVILTDGLPTMDLNGNNWPPLGSTAAAGYGVTATFNADGTLNTTNDQAVTDVLTEISALKSKNVKTYIIGMGAGVNPSNNPQAAATLTAMAIAGGTINYFPATSSAAVATDLDSILSKIEAENLATTAAAVNSTGLHTGSDVYQAKYTSSDTYNDWTGDMLAFAIDPKTGLVNTAISNALWRVQTQIDGQPWNTGSNARLIATCVPTSGICGNSTGTPFEWGTGTAPISATSALGLQLMTSPTDTQGQARLNYLRGDTSNYVLNGGTLRTRTHILGDIVDSNPLYIGAPNGSFVDPTYIAFRNSNNGRKPVIYFGANDGMLHGIDAATGKELFAYIPSGVYANLINLTKPIYNDSHQFFVDGSPTAGDVQFSDSSWHTIVASGLNGGGKSVFALDVTNPTAVTNETVLASDVLWEFTDANMGLSYSRPFIADTDAGFMVVFGSGYDNGGDDYLYFINAQTGALVQKVDLCTAAKTNPCSSTAPNGVSSPVVVNSGGAIGTTDDTVYVGDLQGNLFKVTIPNVQSGTTTYAVTVLFQARDSSGNMQPITTTPVVSLHPNFPKSPYNTPVVYFGTGQFLGTGDITNANVQSFYGVWDNSIVATPPFTRSNLVQQVVTDATITVCVTQPTGSCVNTTEVVRTITNNAIDWTKFAGFYMDLGTAISASDSGERVITDPRLVNGSIIFTTYVPTTTSCTGGGESFLMDVNYQTLGSFALPQIDLNGDGKLDSSDQVNGSNPVGLNLGAVYASSPTVITASLGNIGAVKLISKSTGQIQTVAERGSPHSRESWRQIQ
ncbi:MAG TPA: PilC/PilY family type IV pilus protein [Gammaproteobacteria bacterium]|nr:PilC/PilY family type IV pilus protein [Gammaproteobacteria bacterium]